MGLGMRLTKEQRNTLKQKYGGRCAYCGCNLPNRWAVDHILPIMRGCGRNNSNKYPERDVVDNLHPACMSCNIDKSSLSIEGFREKIDATLHNLREYNSTYRRAKRYFFVEELPHKTIFLFEKWAELHKND